MNRILVATDAWRPQVNGVVRTYERVIEQVGRLGIDVAVLSPDEFRTVPCPTYAEIRLALPRFGYVIDRIDTMKPDAVHIATEGPIGWMVRRYCQQRRLPFTTSFHTRFPDYVTSRTGLPAAWTWAVMRRFHNASSGIMVATKSLSSELQARGFMRLQPWTRGVDTDVFKPRPVRRFGTAPVFLYVGRVAIEKNIEAFLKLSLPGRKVVVGTGPLLDTLRARYPDVLFTGRLDGEALAESYASSDVFVFPSRTDTFGIVLLEAMAAGVPIAAYPVTGPLDTISNGQTGILDDDLGLAAIRALALDRERVRHGAEHCGWDTCARQFIRNIEDAVAQPSGSPVAARADGSRRVRPV
jgi:glycosyltransferase involved in cell wall biosynthesis